MAHEARKAARKARTELRLARRAATSAAERMEAGNRYADKMRAAGFEYDPSSNAWVRVKGGVAA